MRRKRDAKQFLRHDLSVGGVLHGGSGPCRVPCRFPTHHNLETRRPRSLGAYRLWHLWSGAVRVAGLLYLGLRRPLSPTPIVGEDSSARTCEAVVCLLRLLSPGRILLF